MATLKKRRGKWYARVRVWDGIRQREKQIPLRTRSRAEARARLIQVEKLEVDIKDGLEFTFPWLEDEVVRPQLKQLTVEDAFKAFYDSRLIDGLRITTLQRYEDAIKTLYQVLDRKTPLKAIDARIVDLYKKYWWKKHAVSTININLSKIRAFLNWCVKKELLSSVPVIDNLLEAWWNQFFLSLLIH